MDMSSSIPTRTPEPPAPRATCWFCTAPLVGGACPDCDRDTDPIWPDTAKAASVLHTPTGF